MIHTSIVMSDKVDDTHTHTRLAGAPTLYIKGFVQENVSNKLVSVSGCVSILILLAPRAGWGMLCFNFSCLPFSVSCKTLKASA